MYTDISFIDKQIDRIGESVNIEVYSGKTYSDYGDLLAQTSTIYSVKGIFNTYGQNQRFVPEGQFIETKFSFFFKGSQTGIEEDNIIVRTNGERWKINRSYKHAEEGRVVVQEASVTNG